MGRRPVGPPGSATRTSSRYSTCATPFRSVAVARNGTGKDPGRRVVKNKPTVGLVRVTAGGVTSVLQGPGSVVVVVVVVEVVGGEGSVLVVVVEVVGVTEGRVLVVVVPMTPEGCVVGASGCVVDVTGALPPPPVTATTVPVTPAPPAPANPAGSEGSTETAASGMKAAKGLSLHSLRLFTTSGR